MKIFEKIAKNIKTADANLNVEFPLNIYPLSEFAALRLPNRLQQATDRCWITKADTLAFLIEKHLMIELAL